MTRLEQLRYERGLSRQALADRSGVAIRTIRNLEDGNVTKPSAATLKPLADALDIAVLDLLRSFIGDDEKAAA